MGGHGDLGGMGGGPLEGGSGGIGGEGGQPPTSICGNGLIQGDEECDDGGTEDSDGCSASCEAEG